jgi:hypothetical protein
METHDLEVAFKTHEAQCEERWKTIFARVEDNRMTLQRIETRMMAIGGTIILFLLGILFEGMQLMGG